MNSEISSTEKLLEHIRGEERSSEPLTTSPASQRSGSPVLFGRHATVGIDLQQTRLMVAVTAGSGSASVLTGLHVFPYPQGVGPGDMEFTRFLQSKLKTVTGGLRTPAFWAVHSGDIRIARLKIPQVNGNQLAETIYWSFQKEFKFKEADTVFDFRVRKNREAKNGQQVVTAYATPEKKIRAAETLLKKSGAPLAGLSSLDFLLENILNTDPSKNNGVTVNLHINEGSSSITLFTNGRLDFTREIKTGLTSILENTLDALPLASSLNDAPQISRTELRSRMFSADPGDNRTDLENGMRPSVQRLARQIERTVQHYASLAGATPEIGTLTLTGTACGIPEFPAMLQDTTGFPVRVIDPLDLPAQPHVQHPPSPEERQTFLGCIAAAFSSRAETVNFLETFQDRDNRKKISRITRGLGITLFIAAGALGALLWRGHHAGLKTEAAIARQQRGDSTARPSLSTSKIDNAITALERQAQNMEESTRKLQALLVIGEMASATMPPVHLLDADMTLSGGSGELVLTGLVTGPRSDFEMILAEYLIRLNQSPLFQGTSIREQRRTTFPGQGDVLRFLIRIQLQNLTG